MSTRQLSKRHVDFLIAYTAEVERFVQEYKQQDDPTDPISVFWTHNFDYERMDNLPEYADIYTQYRYSKEEAKVLWEPIQEINYRAETELRDWFQKVGYDYEHIPQAPDIDHVTPFKVKYWKPAYQEHKDFRSVVLLGQVIVERKIWNSEHHYTLYETHTGMSFPIRLNFSGDRAEKEIYRQKILTFASKLSQLTNWGGFDTLPKKVQRTIGVELKKIQGELGL